MPDDDYSYSGLLGHLLSPPPPQNSNAPTLGGLFGLGAAMQPYQQTPQQIPWGQLALPPMPLQYASLFGRSRPQAEVQVLDPDISDANAPFVAQPRTQVDYFSRHSPDPTRLGPHNEWSPDFNGYRGVPGPHGLFWLRGT